MKRTFKKIAIVSIAAAFFGAGINGLALAANEAEKKPVQIERDMPPMMHKMMKDMDLTDTQKAKLKAIKEKRQALQDEFWAVFTEAQKTQMLERMTSGKHKGMHGKHRDHASREKGEHKRWDKGDNSERRASQDDTSQNESEK